MNKNNVIERVKVLLDEISPFEEPISFIAAADDTSYDKVKPILSYINSSMNDAVHFCLDTLPLSLLSRDVEDDMFKIILRPSNDSLKVGFVEDFDKYYRLVRVEYIGWERACTAFITSSDPAYLLQQNKHTRGGVSKPVVVYVPDLNGLELYTIPQKCYKEQAHIFYIQSDKDIEKVKSAIDEFVAIKCAEKVFNIFNNENGSTHMKNEWNAKLASILQ